MTPRDPTSTDRARTFRVVLPQPLWRATDFAPAGGFGAWIDVQMAQLRPHVSAEHPTLVVLTELNGLPLLLRGAFLATRAPSFASAILLMLFKHLPATLLTAHRTGTTPVQAVQLLLAPRVVTTYLDVCRSAAVKHRVYLVSGSVPIPHLVQDGTVLRLDGSGLYNEALIFAPDGHLIGATDKVHLTDSEGPSGLDLTGGTLADLHVYPTPVGDLGVATSLDAFEADVIARLEAQGATVLVQPDANGVPWTAQALDGTHRDQPLVWLESCWQAVQRSGTLRYGLNPMVVGNFLGEPFDGQSAIVSKPEDAPQERSYVMTAPRPGFLKLLPWVTTGTRAELQAASAALAPGSGSPRENGYRTGTLSADLHLPATALPVPEPTSQERALRAYLSGQAHFLPDPAVTALAVLWPLFWLAVSLLGLRATLNRRPSGLLVLLLGLIGSVLVRF